MRFNLGSIAVERKDWNGALDHLRQAEDCWRRILTLRRPDQFCSVDQGIYGHLTLRNLAVLAEERGDLAGAEECWRRVLAECPGDLEASAKLERLGQ